MTITDALHDAEIKLRAHQRPGSKERHRPRWEAEILLSELLQKDRTWILAHGTDTIQPAVLRRFNAWITRRCSDEPIAYILGNQEFYGRSFNVSTHTLIPRPETEMLVDLATVTDPSHTVIWDVGTGSGAIAITLALAHPAARILASDISSEAIAVAKQNAKSLGVLRRITFTTGSLITPFTQRKLKQLAHDGYRSLIITANLPYLPERDAKRMMPDVVKFEPLSALFAGTDGLDLIRAFISHLALAQHEWKFDHIQALFEFDPSQTKRIRNIALNAFPKATITILKDFAKRDRVMQIVM